MKIAQVVSTYPPYRGGMGMVAFEYTKHLRSLGHHVHVYTPRYACKEVDEDSKYIHRLTCFGSLGNAGFIPSLAMRLSGFDIIHLHYPFFGGAEPVILRKCLQKNQRLILTYHMDVVGTGWKGRFFDMHRRMLFPWIIERCDRIFVSSQEYAKTSRLQAFPHLASRIEIHPFGVDTQRFFPGDEQVIRKKWNIPPNSLVLLFVGGLDRAHYFKGLSILLDVLAQIHDLPWYMFVVGDGDLQATYEKQARINNLDDRVFFVGNIEEEEKPSYYRSAQIHVFPSIDRSESFGLVALEAGATGIPTIASDLPGVNSFVKHEQTGLLIHPGDAQMLKQALEKLIINPSLAKQLGTHARRSIEQYFTWPSLIDRLEASYENCLNKQSVSAN
ncbi:hypothetical protein CO172_00160 [Candidatus Uhrbacteria bacterium CG_4_9_14_3_um_filter_36_7]|uniref:Glycosyltransferase family 1 protein n=1 Tax=Candidatus Uhrbacteria bacterium CG_4_9_14_3_um_filter_36_7 TaxID=1975033 RepID=A0A2M7XIK7_9BACT|nr:MAG: hypothetical protein CO172_00160 [Candidatus Uhrbacteria bacterium CG_4_9_14_3_um_filter_36_7]